MHKEGGSVEEKRVTEEMLSSHDGRDGRPAWVAIKGEVFDLSQSRLWRDGEHMKRHLAGRDLTDQIQASPHGLEVLKREVVRRVGILVPHEEVSPLPGSLKSVLERFPILRRHPHPMMVHFPMAYVLGALFLLIVESLAPQGWFLERCSFALLVMGILFTPIAIVTGLLTWWVNYGARPMHQVKRKLQLAVVLALAEIASLIVRARGPIRDEILEGLYFGLLVIQALCILGLGWYGGHLTFPYTKGR